MNVFYNLLAGKYTWGMRRLRRDKRPTVIHAHCEGNSISATARLCGVSKLTVLRLLADVGSLCRDFHDLMVRGLSSRRVQVDEIWSFVGCKAKTKAAGGNGHGDVWTWTAICAETKLVPCWLIGRRDADCAHIFMRDLAKRLVHRVQLTTDGLRAYLEAVESAFGGAIDYAMLVKIYGNEQKPGNARYSPAACIGLSCARIHVPAWAIALALRDRPTDPASYYADEPAEAAVRALAEVAIGPGRSRLLSPEPCRLTEIEDHARVVPGCTS